MSSLRHRILAAIARDIVALDDIVAHLGGNSDQVRNNMNAARHDGLIARYLDEYTRRPSYKLTEAGRERLKAVAAPKKIKQAPAPKPQGGCPSLRCEQYRTALAEIVAMRPSASAPKLRRAVEIAQRALQEASK